MGGTKRPFAHHAPLRPEVQLRVQLRHYAQVHANWAIEKLRAGISDLRVSASSKSTWKRPWGSCRWFNSHTERTRPKSRANRPIERPGACHLSNWAVEGKGRHQWRSWKHFFLEYLKTPLGALGELLVPIVTQTHGFGGARSARKRKRRQLTNRGPIHQLSSWGQATLTFVWALLLRVSKNAPRPLGELLPLLGVVSYTD